MARVISPEAKATLTYVCLTIYGYVNGIFAVFYGTAAMVRGYLISLSGYLPRALGAFFMLGGAGFIAKSILVVAAPHYDVPYVFLPMFSGVELLGVLVIDQGYRSGQMGCDPDDPGIR